MVLPSLLIPVVILVLVASHSIAFQSISPLAVCGSRTHKSSLSHNQFTQQPNFHIIRYSNINMGISSSSSSTIVLLKIDNLTAGDKIYHSNANNTSCAQALRCIFDYTL